MNYLAHLHIAKHTQTSLLGNFLGDFIKGNPAGKFNTQVEQGIRLHRFVDSYIDSHDLVRSIKPLFDEELRRFAPIALDMFWDHCLAKRWQHYNEESLQVFSLQAQWLIETEELQLKEPLPERFHKVAESMWKGNWFKHYTDINNIDFALQRIAMRRPRMAPLAKTFVTLVEHYEQLDDTFLLLYPDILSAANIKTKKETQ